MSRSTSTQSRTMTKVLFLLLTATLVSCGDDGGAVKSKHVFVIGVDGLLVEGLQEASTPVLDGLIADGAVTYDAFAGGELGTPTSSRPSAVRALLAHWAHSEVRITRY